MLTAEEMSEESIKNGGVSKKDVVEKGKQKGGGKGRSFISHVNSLTTQFARVKVQNRKSRSYPRRIRYCKPTRVTS